MKPFLFRLQTALDMKIHLEDQVKSQLEHALQLYEGSVAQLKALESQLLLIQNEIRGLQAKPFNVDEIKKYNDFVPLLNERIERQNRDVEEKSVKVAEIRRALIEIMKDRKILEKIKARNYQAYLRQVLLEEQKQIDEMALQRFNRKGNSE